MKRLFLIIALAPLLALTQGVNIIELSIHPSNPSDQDSIFLHTLTGMVALPITVQNENVADSGSYFIVNVCQWAGPSMMPTELADTFALGVKPPGHYKVYFIGNGTYCSYPSNLWIDSIEFDVGYASIEKTEISGFSIWPNPANEGIINITGFSNNYSYELSDLKGSIFQSESNKCDPLINLSRIPYGTYILILNSEGIFERRKIIIQ